MKKFWQSYWHILVAFAVGAITPLGVLESPPRRVKDGGKT